MEALLLVFIYAGIAQEPAGVYPSLLIGQDVGTSLFKPRATGTVQTLLLPLPLHTSTTYACTRILFLLSFKEAVPPPPWGSLIAVIGLNRPDDAADMSLVTSQTEGRSEWVSLGCTESVNCWD